MSKDTEVEFQGQMRPATSVQIVKSNETFNEYQLEDGTTVKLKTVVVDVARLKDLFDSEGNPIYVMKSTGVVHVDAAEDLRKK